ncbi:glycosomal membrane protein [Angomonas deanei]|nr:glycosomal membrane protein [Angomonas deanei]|eukprot:EPY41830.1 glycosomal membrane protein [Angomonas deanei]
MRTFTSPFFFSLVFYRSLHLSYAQMTSDYTRVVNLLGQTDGRDKIYKFTGGLCKVLAELSEGPSKANYKKLGSSITSARSLMRMAKFVGDGPKLLKIVDLVKKDGICNVPLAKIIEFFRTIGNSLYILGDNLAFIAKHKLIAADAKQITKYAKTAQFWGFFLAAVLDLIAINAALQKRAADAAASKKEVKKSAISLTKNTADVLVTMATVGYLKEVWHPTTLVSGALTCVSGGVATYLNWEKTKK